MAAVYCFFAYGVHILVLSNEFYLIKFIFKIKFIKYELRLL